MTDKEYFFIKKNLLCSKDSKIGFTISVNLKGVLNENKEKQIVYTGLSVRSAGIGSCVENNSLIFLFEDSTKVTLTSWNDFNCKGNSYFDLRGKEFEKFSTKKIKAIRFQNGRTYETYTYVLMPEQKDYFITIAELIKLNKSVEAPCD